MKKTIFKDCVIKEADFSDADLTEARFLNCDLSMTRFHYTTLDKADLRTAGNFSIDPELNKLKKTKFSSSGIIGLLDKYDIVVE